MPPAVPVSEAVSSRVEVWSRTALVLLWSVMLMLRSVDADFVVT